MTVRPPSSDSYMQNKPLILPYAVGLRRIACAFAALHVFSTLNMGYEAPPRLGTRIIGGVRIESQG